MGIPLGNNMGVHIHTYTILDLKNIYQKKQVRYDYWSKPMESPGELTPHQLGVLDVDVFNLQKQGTDARFTVSPCRVPSMS